MEMNKKNLVLLTLAGGIMIFFFGIGMHYLLGASTATDDIPTRASDAIKLSGMGLICIAMIVGGFFVEKFDKDTKMLLLIFGFILLVLNIFVLSATST